MKPEIKKCAICGKKFKKSRQRKGRTCNKKCQLEDRLRKRKEKYKKNKEARGKARQRTRKIISMPGHPLASRNGRLQFYRFLLYNKIGKGPHRCYWCNKKIDWMRGERVSEESSKIVVDHVDNNSLNNNEENLVPSCYTCNTYRDARGIKAYKSD